MTNPSTRRRNSEAGAELIEFALVFPLLLMIILGIVDFALMFQRYEVVTNAVREGARVAVLPGYTETDVQARVASYIAERGLPTTGENPTVAVTATTIPEGGAHGRPRPSPSTTPTTTASWGRLPGGSADRLVRSPSRLSPLCATRPPLNVTPPTTATPSVIWAL